MGRSNNSNDLTSSVNEIFVCIYLALVVQRMGSFKLVLMETVCFTANRLRREYQEAVVHSRSSLLINGMLAPGGQWEF